MNCKLCGAEIPEGTGFCSVCGSPVESTQAAAPVNSQRSLSCSVCGNPIPAGAQFCDVCGNPSSVSSAPSYAQSQASQAPQPPKEAPAEDKGAAVKEKLDQALSFAKDPKNRNTVLIGLGAIALILVVILLISSLGGGGVTSSISKAMDKTVMKGNFTADFSIKVDGEKISGTAMVNMNAKKQQLTALIEMKMDGEKVILGIYEGEMFRYIPSMESGMVNDISDELEDIFAAMDDRDALLDLYEDITGVELEDLMDIDAAEKGLKKLVKKMDSKSWLKENAGYTSEKKDGATVHVFEPDLYELLAASIIYFEDALDEYDEMVESLEDEEDVLSDIDITLEVGVKSGKLTSVEADIMKSVKISVEFSDVGKTKIDTEELEDYIKDCD